MKRVALALGALALVALAGVGLAWQSMQRYLDTPMAIDAPEAVSIPQGATLRGVLESLSERGITEGTHWLRLDARLNKTANQIKAGDYELEPGTTPRQMMAAFVSGAVRLERVTLIEGWTAAEAVHAIVTHPAVADDLGITLGARADGTPWLDAASHEALAQRLALDEGGSIEGWLFPDTYRFARGTAASALLAQSHEAMRKQLEAAWAAVEEAGPIGSAYEALILGSIIEKETALESERGRIAGVFVRRLESGMRLETDPTVIYGIGEAYDGDIRRRDLRAVTDYNTYRIAGLPPTPIALPGRASIDAALAPVDGEALFFVATGLPDGSHYFSATIEEHNAAVARYLKELRSQR